MAIVIKGPEDWINSIYENAPQNDPNKDKPGYLFNWNLPTKIGISFHDDGFAFPENTDDFSEVLIKDSSDQIRIPHKVLQEHGVISGDANISISSRASGYEVVDDIFVPGIKVTKNQAPASLQVWETVSGKDKGTLNISVDTADEVYLTKLFEYILLIEPNFNSFSGPISAGSEDNLDRISQPGKTILTMGKNLMKFALSGIKYNETEKCTIELKAKGYEKVSVDFEGTNFWKMVPEYWVDIQHQGLVLSSDDKEYLESIRNQAAGESDLSFHGDESKGNNGFGIGNISDSDSFGEVKETASEDPYKGKYYMEVSITLDHFARSNASTDVSYSLGIYTDGSYMDSMSYTVLYNLGRVVSYRLAQAQVQNTSSATSETGDDISEQLTALDDKVKDMEYVSVTSETEDKTTGVSGLGINGQTSGALMADPDATEENGDELYTEDMDNTQPVAIQTSFSDPAVSTEELVANSGFDDVEATDVAFDATITKQVGDQDPVEIKRLPYTAELSFDLPEDVTLGKDQKFALLTKHDGEYSKLDVKVKDGKGYAYTKRFSTFALVVENSTSTAKEPAVVTKAPVGNELTYNGTAQALVTDGTSEGGKIEYSLDQKKWSAEIPSAKDAGTYTVYYKVKADADHTDSATESVTVVIKKAVYKVTIDLADGSEAKVQQVTDGEDAVLPSDPERKGYVFTGWDSDGKNITKDTTIKAQWKIQEFKVIFDYGNGTTVEQTVEFGSDVKLPSVNPERKGYVFTGWSSDGKNITEDTKITAQWEIQKFKVTIDYGNGTKEEQTVEYGSDAKLPSVNPARKGYVFTGWSSDGKDITADTTITAQWKKAVHKVTIDLADGSEPKVQQVTDGEDAVLPPDPERKGYVFTGWSSDGKNITEDTKIIAQWEIQKFKVTIDYGNGTTEEQTVAFGQDVKLPAVDPVWDGHVFAGWSSEGKAVAEDTTITAEWKEVTSEFITTPEEKEAGVEASGSSLVVPVEGNIITDDALKQAIAEGTISESDSIERQSYLDVKKDKTSENSLVYTIVPMYRDVAVAADGTVKKIFNEGEIEELTKADAYTPDLKMTLSVAGIEAAEGTTVYVIHTKTADLEFVYAETVAADQTVTFVNPHGFSTFTITKENPVKAMIGSDMYTSLKGAVSRVKDGETIVIPDGVDAGSTAVDRAVSFTLKLGEGSKAEITAAPGYALTTNGDVYTVTAVAKQTASKPEQKSGEWHGDNVTLMPAGQDGYDADGRHLTSLGNGTVYDDNYVVWDGYQHKLGRYDPASGRVVALTDSATSSSTTTNKSLIPNTADHFHLFRWAAALVVSGLAAVFAMHELRKR